MVGAVEFLRKAKAIQDDDTYDGYLVGHNLIDYICGYGTINEADLVAKVMAYKIKEVSE